MFPVPLQSLSNYIIKIYKNRHQTTLLCLQHHENIAARL